MAQILQRLVMQLAQQVIVKQLANSPVFQRFAVRTANYAKSVEQQVMNAGQQKVGSRATAESAARQRAQQTQQQAQEQQRRQQQQGSASDAGLFLHRARAFASALKEEVGKDLGSKGR
uniref:Uncharacterized protein n=1 Tax=Prymnesium polylepis TaxID=72548 RepID=A0A6V4QL01_9EUKA|mmetsp:Transcript_45129/g.125166  ORF Transcript_45129/g.125166 Transcript_45129/m.125166 type:complete len:118 (+) Transcript_45129:47-400(+)